jgi:hypothetical protein
LEIGGILLELKWPQVDFKNGVVRFIRMQNRKPVPLAAPIYGDMGEWLRRQKEFRGEHFPECEFVFFWYPIDCEIDPTLKSGHGGRRNVPGSPIKTFYESWRRAGKDAGFPDFAVSRSQKICRPKYGREDRDVREARDGNHRLSCGHSGERRQDGQVDEGAARSNGKKRRKAE